MAKGGNMIANSLKQNNQLKILDLSWNGIGTGGANATEVGNTWGNALLENKTLQHLDLSMNKIRKKDTEKLADKLKFNHTLYGIHY